MKLSVGIVVGLPTYVIELNMRLKAKAAFRGANTVLEPRQSLLILSATASLVCQDSSLSQQHLELYDEAMKIKT